MSDFDAWDVRTRDLLEDAYLAAGEGPRGSGSGHASVGDWRAKREHLTVPMDGDGSWLDVGCANGFLMATLPAWCDERDVKVEPHGLELLPKVADLARVLHPGMADRIWTGSVMEWSAPRRFTYVTAIEDQVPPARLKDLVNRLLEVFVEPGGRLILSAYSNQNEMPRDLFGDLVACGHEQVDGFANRAAEPRSADHSLARRLAQLRQVVAGRRHRDAALRRSRQVQRRRSTGTQAGRPQGVDVVEAPFSDSLVDPARCDSAKATS